MNVTNKTKSILRAQMNVIEFHASKAESASPFGAMAAVKELARAQLDFNRALILALCVDSPSLDGQTK
jgi:hypothetical protein